MIHADDCREFAAVFGFLHAQARERNHRSRGAAVGRINRTGRVRSLQRTGWAHGEENRHKNCMSCGSHNNGVHKWISHNLNYIYITDYSKNGNAKLMFKKNLILIYLHLFNTAREFSRLHYNNTLQQHIATTYCNNYNIIVRQLQQHIATITTTYCNNYNNIL